MRRGKFSANFENAEFLAVSVVSIVSYSNQEGFHGLLGSDLYSGNVREIPGLIDSLMLKNEFRYF